MTPICEEVDIGGRGEDGKENRKKERQEDSQMERKRRNWNLMIRVTFDGDPCQR